MECRGLHLSQSKTLQDKTFGIESEAPHEKPLGIGLKRIVFCLILLSLSLSSTKVSALNETSHHLLDRLFEKGEKATREELLEILIPVAGDTVMTHMQKNREMGYLVYISGWHLSTSEKNSLYTDVFRTLDRQRKKIYLKNHAHLGDQIREAIKAGGLLVGMSQESVKASLGDPEEINPAIGTFFNTERWTYYNKRKVLFFKKGVLASFKNQ